MVAAAVAVTACDDADSTVPGQGQTAALSNDLDIARARWAEAEVESYRLAVTEQTNYWSAGCTWITVVTDGSVTGGQVASASSTSSCIPTHLTVERLHELVAGWIDEIERSPQPESGALILQVDFDDIGVPVALTYDHADIADEETSMRATFEPTG